MVNEPTSAFPEVPGGSSGSGAGAPHGGQPTGDPAPDSPPPTFDGLGGPPGGTPPRTLTGWLPMALGVLFIVLGAVWTLQGLDVLTGSKMSGTQIWVVIGPVVGVVGLALAVLGVRLRTRSKR